MALDTSTSPHTSATFTDDQLARLRTYGTPHHVAAGDVLYGVGDVGYDLILIDEGTAEIVREERPDAAAEVVAKEQAGGILGEMSLLTRQAVYLTARMTSDGAVHRISSAALRRLMSEDAELSDILLRTFMARRDELRASAARSLEILGDERSSGALALRTYAARLQLPHTWFDVSTPECQALTDSLGLTAEDLPTVIAAGTIIRNATPGQLADRLGLSYRPSDQDVDLIVVGAGPAGLAAAVYGSSEGLRTVLLDAVGPGGQAAASSRIENYLGFPNGLSGAELTGLAQTQALKFGTDAYSPCQVKTLTTTEAGHRIELEDGVVLTARAVIVATGARYRTLPLERWAHFEGAGIYYAATEIETRRLAGLPVTVVGGANSAGQAAIFLASKGCPVSIVIRSDDIRAGMSSYLVERILADPAITVRTGAEVTALHGEDYLDGVTLHDAAGDRVEPSAALFCFIGAIPASDWLPDIERDPRGFIFTDVDVSSYRGDGSSRPLPFETSIPAIFAVGDVRHGSMKRVAAAVGEGASAVASTHAALARI
ncbi:FAD-dependent oxidoreductase [Curtobacterium flaccumfaciens]|uniref:FAD-dependent oxidoreductase n=1 Tax=Curtobacterium flaccumfaciens TaxID=2035 RepID=UPI0039916F15